MRVRLLGTGGAANEARHQASLLVEWGEGSGAGRVLLDTGSGLDIVRLLISAGCEPAAVSDIFVSHQHSDHVGGLEPLLLWSIITTLRAQGRPPSGETRVYADRRILAKIAALFETVGTAVPRLFGDKLRWIEAADGQSQELRSGGSLTAFLVDHEPMGGGAVGCDRARRDAACLQRRHPPCGPADRGGPRGSRPRSRGWWPRCASRRHPPPGSFNRRDAGRVAAAAGVGRLILTHLPIDGLAEPMLAEARAAFGGPVELASDQALIEISANITCPA
jgi:hypothetical protein